MSINRITYDKGRCGFDELVAGNAIVHIERMSNGHIWMAVESGSRRVVLNFHSHRGISVNLEEEPVQCQHDLTKPNPTIAPLGSAALGSSDWTWMCRACNDRFNLPLATASALETSRDECGHVWVGSTDEPEKIWCSKCGTAKNRGVK